MPWKKGQSGNPKEKAAGQTPRGKFRAQVDAALPKIVANLVEAAEAGDMQASKLILDRCIPALKPTSDPQALPIKSGASLQEQGQAVVDAMHSGTIDHQQAASAMSVLETQRRLVEQSEILDRLASIETWLSGKK